MPATCTTDGYTGDQVCSICGEIVKKGEIIPAKGHSPETRNAKEPTCTEPGYTGDTYCSACGEKLSAGEAIPALAHDYAAVVTAPTCTEKGYTTYSCSRCGDTYVGNEVAALGHDWDAGVVTTEPTCEAAGVKTFTCKHDPSHTGMESVPALGHSWGAWTVTKPATETTEGVETRTCSRCGKAETRSIPKVEPTHCDGGPSCPSIKLTDVDRSPSSWYHEAVDWAYVSGVTQGTSPTLFSPTAACTRGQAVTFLWRALGSPEPKATKCDFVDVSSGAYYYKAVLWAGENGVTNGIDAKHFGPDVECSRGHIVTFLYRAMKGTPVSGASFSDVPAGEWFSDPVSWAVSKGITNGVGSGLFAPNNTCTRAHIVTFLYRMVKQK